MFEAKVNSAATYMFKVLASSWRKKRIIVNPLQCYITCTRNFPADLASEASTAATLAGLGLPKKIVWENLSCIDDVDYAIEQYEAERDNIPSLLENTEDDDEDLKGEDEKTRNVLNDEK